MAGDLVQERQYLRVKIGGKDVRLEALFVKRADTTGRLPIAFFNHGRPAVRAMAVDQSLLDDPGINLIADIARRGWLVVAINRRGYGLSDGPVQSDSPCAADSFMSWMNADADDIEAAIGAVARRTDADPTRMIAIGTSAGGAASLALGARNPAGLVAVIDIAGGEHMGGCPVVADSVPVDFRTLGSRSHVPNLWVFAKNDPNHPVDQIEVMRAAFTGAGADLKLALLEPIGEDGHTGLGSNSGRAQWLLEVDNFLRAHNLPTWPVSNVDVVLQKLRWPQTSRNYVQAYLAAPGEKAFARTPGNQNAAYRTALTLDDARRLALDACQQKGEPCTIVMEDDRWTGSQ
ncbi:alpha/beta hydrolase family protein [Bradyrhizobium acaciae]|uniref:alpha/beta hydrolase family protein n=1 Tax=Bradyrhizobium acaciae TaxID=2683706 RepID=UPI001E640B47|nr:alpha/beta hydrolase [Bradyrhizobium acaciae]MCC8982146.1 alpha/beta hydrolase [Bradyrhizobium acaciae]